MNQQIVDFMWEFVLDDEGIKCECVITDERDGILEIKNIVAHPGCQRRVS